MKVAVPARSTTPPRVPFGPCQGRSIRHRRAVLLPDRGRHRGRQEPQRRQGRREADRHQGRRQDQGQGRQRQAQGEGRQRLPRRRRRLRHVDRRQGRRQPSRPTAATTCSRPGTTGATRRSPAAPGSTLQHRHRPRARRRHGCETIRNARASPAVGPGPGQGLRLGIAEGSAATRSMPSCVFNLQGDGADASAATSPGSAESLGRGRALAVVRPERRLGRHRQLPLQRPRAPCASRRRRERRRSASACG